MADKPRKRATAIEMLAREICWAGFSAYKPHEGKAAYWDKVAPERKEQYLTDARVLTWTWEKAHRNRQMQRLIGRAIQETRP